MKKILMAALLLLLALCSNANTINLLNPENWSEGLVELEGGEIIRGKLFLEHEEISKYVLVKHKRRIKNQDSRYGVFRGRRLHEEKLYIYKEGKVAIYKPSQIASFYFIKEGEQFPSYFVSLPFTFEDENSDFYFFELLEDGPMSLMKRTVNMTLFGSAETYFFVTEQDELIPCPYTIREVMTFFSKNTEGFTQEQTAWGRMMNTVYEHDLLALFREYNESVANTKENNNNSTD